MSPSSGDIAFVAILRPWLRTRYHGNSLLAETDDLLTADARRGLEQGILARLADLATPVLLHLFDRERTVPPLARMTVETPPSAPTQAHDRFIDAVNTAGLEQALAPWQVLLTLLGRLADDGMAAVGEFIRHARADTKRLSRAMPGWRGTVPVITDARFGLSDPHGRGRSVGRIRFADGTVLAYKPRPMAVDAAFCDLLNALAAEGGSPDQRIPLVVDCGDHGWMEWVGAAPMRHRREAAAFYRRCGGLQALMSVLRGGDIHADNLIAAGAHPVIVDLECLFQPGLTDLGMTDPLLDPITPQAGLLPTFTSFDGGSTLVPVAAAGTATMPSYLKRHLVHVGTDWMHEAEWPHPAFDEPGPHLGSLRLDVRDHAGDFADGYSRTLRSMARNWAAWAQKGQPLYRLSRAPVRFLAAPTNLYAMLLENIRQPGVLAGEALFAQRLGWVARRPPRMADAKAWQKLLAVERAALDRLDVPAFRFQANRRALREVDGQPAGSLPCPPMADRVMAGLAALTPNRIRAETALVAACLRRPDPACDTPATIDARQTLSLLADQMAELAVPTGRGVQWVRMWEEIPAPIAPAGPSLCYGATGIALSLAASARALDDARLARLARRALLPWTGRRGRAQAGKLAAALGPGWGYGIGGMIAALVWCAERLDQPSLLDDALSFAMVSDKALQVGPTVPDILTGAAGLLLGLSVLHHRRPLPAVQAAMRACGEEILKRSRLSGNARDWPDRGRPGLAGLSHGAGGIAAALAQLVCLDGKRGPWAAAVTQALIYEDRLFRPATATWGDSDRHTWCHGAPGIALTRQALAGTGTGLVPTDDAMLVTAIGITRKGPIQDIDDLCCGEAGRLDILLTLAAQRGDDALKAEAEAALAARQPDWASGRARLMAAQAGAPGDASLLRGLGGLAHLLVRHLAPAHAADILLPVNPPAYR